MDRYENLGTVGEGSYGVVTKCKDKTNGLIVAIKKFLETDSDKAVKKIATREIKILKSLRHENLVNLIEVFRRNKRIYLVFEFIEHNLLEEIEKTSNGLGETRTKEVMYQVVRGLDFMHSNNFIHRDLKPENVLINKNGLIKLCDFGFARQIAQPSETYTDYVATRWYRSPELLVGDPKYGKPVDIWSLGALAYEVLTSKPLFPGESDLDQLYLIINSLGDLPDSMKMCFQQNHFYMNAKFPRMKNFNSLQNKLKKYSNNLIKFIMDALIVDPHKRSTSSELLQHEFFTSNGWVDEFLNKLKNIVSIYESSISKSLANKNKHATKKATTQPSTHQSHGNIKLSNHKHLENHKQSEINRLNEINKQNEIAKLNEISKFIIQSEKNQAALLTGNSGNTNASSTTLNNESKSNLTHNNNIVEPMFVSKQKTLDTMSQAKSSLNNFNTINSNTKLPKIESTSESPQETITSFKMLNGNTSRQAISPISNNNNNNVFKSETKLGQLMLKHQSNSVDLNLNNLLTGETNLKSNSIHSIGPSMSLRSSDLASNSLTNTNKQTVNNNNNNTSLHSNSNYFNGNNVYILEETFKLSNNGNANASTNKASLKRQNELKSITKMEGLNLPQVKPIELYSKNGKSNVYEKNPFLMPINKK